MGHNRTRAPQQMTDYSITSSAATRRVWQHLETERLGGIQINPQIESRPNVAVCGSFGSSFQQASRKPRLGQARKHFVLNPGRDGVLADRKNWIEGKPQPLFWQPREAQRFHIAISPRGLIQPLQTRAPNGKR